MLYDVLCQVRSRIIAVGKVAVGSSPAPMS